MADKSYYNLLYLCRRYLPGWLRVKALSVFLISLINIIFEVLLIALLVPLIEIIVGGSNEILTPQVSAFFFPGTWLVHHYGGAAPRNIAVLVGGVATISTALKLFALWLGGQVSGQIGSEISQRIYTDVFMRSRLPSSYEDITDGRIIACIGIEIPKLIHSVNSCFQLFSAVITTTGILIGLFSVNVKATSIVVASIFSFLPYN